MSVKRYYVPNSNVFITQVVDGRIPVFQHKKFIEQLRTTLRNVQMLHPFIMLAYVFLPEHFHLLIRPTGDSNFSKILKSLKWNYTLEYKRMGTISGRMRFWQKGFWDHVIWADIDFQRHLDYIHYNPVHHGLVSKPEEWQHSSFVQWQQRNAYAPQWGWLLPESIAEYDWHNAEADNVINDDDCLAWTELHGFFVAPTDSLTGNPI